MAQTYLELRRGRISFETASHSLDLGQTAGTASAYMGYATKR